MKSALTIAGSDPTGGAGLQSDLKTFRSFGVYGYGVPAALTAQNTRGIDSVAQVENGLLRRQLEFLLEDVTPDALKTGMLYTTGAVRVVAGAIRRFSLKNLVVDPVTVSSTGVSLVEEGTIDAIRAELFPLARVITPNIYEASLIAGVMIEGEEDMRQAAKVLKDMGPEVVIVTGGHLDGETIDIYFDGSSMIGLRGEKFQGEYHGTGCAFSAGVTALLSLGRSAIDSARESKEFVLGAIRRALHPGGGMGLLDI